MDDDIARRVYNDPLARWFVTEAYRITDTAALIAATGEEIARAGIPLWRLAYFQFTLHPELAGKSYTWRRGSGRRDRLRAAWPDAADSGFATARCWRCSNSTRACAIGSNGASLQGPVLRELKRDGATDYVALPLIFSTGHVDGLSVVSDAPGGFSRGDLDRMYLLQFAFARLVETHSLRDTATYLLDAYVGRAAGERILAGDGQARRRRDHRGRDLVLRPARLHQPVRPVAARHRDRAAERLFRRGGRGGDRRRRRNPEVHRRRHAGDLSGPGGGTPGGGDAGGAAAMAARAAVDERNRHGGRQASR